MKTPDEIKRGLEWCNSVYCVLNGCADVCPYWDTTFGCGNDYLMEDALAYIRKLEAERDALMADMSRYAMCDACKHFSKERSCPYTNNCEYGTIGHFEWRGVKEEVNDTTGSCNQAT